MLFLYVILHTMWSDKSLQLLCILPWYVVLVCHQYSMIFVKNICWQCVCWWVWWSEQNRTSVNCVPVIFLVVG